MKTNPATRRLRWFSCFCICCIVLLFSGMASDPPPPNSGPLPQPAGGSSCIPAFDFNKPVSQSIVLDGRSCPNPDAGCVSSANDWPFHLDDEDTDYDGFIEERTRIAHYRITPPVPPTQSDLYLAFEASAANINDIVRVSVTLNPGTTPTNGRAFVIQPFGPVPPAAPSAHASLVPYLIERKKFDGLNWVDGSSVIPASAIEAKAAYNTATGYWGVEMKIHLADVGIVGNEFYMATHWKSEAEAGSTLVGAADDWTPWTASPTSGDLPISDPTQWRRYSFGADDCAPDVYINSQWNTCADIYINARDANARKIALNQVNEFHAVVHGDANPGAAVANNVLVYLDISHLGSGAAPYAMNYPFADTHINWEGATSSLVTATPVSPSQFNVAAGTTNDDVRTSWKPSDEHPNPFSDGEHVCVNAYVYFKDDPNLDNNFGQCNMEFVSTVAGRRLIMAINVGDRFRGFEMNPVGELFIVPALANSASRLTSKNEWQIRLAGKGVKQVSSLAHLITLQEKGQSQKVEVSFVVPKGIGKKTDRLDPRRIGDRSKQITRMFYKDRPLLILKSFVPAYSRDQRGKKMVTLRPGSYIGYAFDLK